MAQGNGWGGYREPTNPAPVSGPGALSARTDGSLHAPVPGTVAPGGGDPSAVSGPDLSQIVPFGAPSTRPDEPISAGAPFGPGAGPSFGTGLPMAEETAERLRSYMPVLIVLASQDNVDPATKQFVRQLRGELG